MKVIFVIIGLAIAVYAVPAYHRQYKSGGYKSMFSADIYPQLLLNYLPISLLSCSAFLVLGGTASNWSESQTLLYALMGLTFFWIVLTCHNILLYISSKIGLWFYFVWHITLLFTLVLIQEGMREILPTLQVVWFAAQVFLLVCVVHVLKRHFQFHSFRHWCFLAVFPCIIFPALFVLHVISYQLFGPLSEGDTMMSSSFSAAGFWTVFGLSGYGVIVSNERWFS